MKLNLLKASRILIVLFIFILTTTGCKKDKLEVDGVQDFIGLLQVAPGELVPRAMHLSLNPDGTANFSPGGDVSYRGTYKINGAKMKVKTDEDSYIFEIISDTEIKSKEFGTVLSLMIVDY